MDVLKGKVVGGKIEIEGAHLEDGAVVTVLARGREEPFILSTEQERRMIEAIAEADAGETISRRELDERLDRLGRG